jgi:hypothetical protein
LVEDLRCICCAADVLDGVRGLDGVPSTEGGMSHDMSDPTMAAAMESDMRNRF